MQQTLRVACGIIMHSVRELCTCAFSAGGLAAQAVHAPSPALCEYTGALHVLLCSGGNTFVLVQVLIATASLNMVMGRL